ncbi:MAG TPA: hypothetical protein VFT62_09620 [Mycobacteriales bacterium]|nr:hypothetical protein [Mycobacteriales bacterium]
MTSRFRRAAVIVATATAVAATAVGGWPADAGTSRSAHTWAGTSSATVHPGVVITVAGVRCVAGYVLADRHHVYLAVPASCTGVSDGSPVDGCLSAQVPVGLPVHVQGARHDGVLAYTSFTQMQLTGEQRSNRCANNSLSLVRLDPRDVKRTNPSLPAVGGPSAVSTDASALPDQLSVLLNGAVTQAQATSTTAGGWARGMVVDGQVNAFSVGSPVVDAKGRAVGMVTYVPFQGGPGQTSVSDLGRELRLLRRTPGFAHVHLVRGTAGYAPSALPTPAL